MKERHADDLEQVTLGEGSSVPPVDDTRRRILDAGLEVIRSVGHGQFSVQKVARQAGVYQGNVTYYWPRRRDLVLALAVRMVEDHLRTFEERSSELDPAHDGWADQLVRWMVEDATSTDRVRLLPELWSMANADPEVAREVTRAFDGITDRVLVQLGFGRDAPGAAVLRRALALAGLATQGLTAVHGHRPPDDPLLADLRADLCALHAPALLHAHGLALAAAAAAADAAPDA
jgi:AcrR family transcriptional regulator